jgi:predicted nucleotidyltransferase component of viral defense system
MLGTKLRALMQRTQGRDLFDLYHAGEVGAKDVSPYVVNQAQAIEAFNWYLANEGMRMDREEAERLRRERVQDASFRRDMNTTSHTVQTRPAESPLVCSIFAVYGRSHLHRATRLCPASRRAVHASRLIPK